MWSTSAPSPERKGHGSVDHHNGDQDPIVHGQRTLLAPLGRRREAAAGAMLVACRLAGLSALGLTAVIIME